MKNHATNAEAAASFREALEAAWKSGTWMATVWFPEDGGEVRCHRTTFDFPRELFTTPDGPVFSKAVKSLVKTLSDEAPAAGSHPLPLRVAPDFMRGVAAEAFAGMQESQTDSPEDGEDDPEGIPCGGS